MNDANISIGRNWSACILHTSALRSENDTDSATKQFPDDADLPEGAEIFLGLLLVCMIVISFLGNSVVCFIVYQKSAMRSAINLLLTNMAFSDICTATFSMTFSFSALFWKEHILGPESCKVMLFLLDTFVSVSVFMILTISMDRYMIIVQRKDRLTTCRAKMLMITSWLVSMAMAFPSTVGWGDYKFVRSHTICRLTFDGQANDVGFMILKLCVTYFLPVVVMTFSFIQILGAVRKNKCRVHNHPNMDFSVSVISNNGRLGIPVLQRSFRVSLDMSFKTRAFKTILILFITFVLCWTPHALNTIISQYQGTVSRTRHLILLWVGYANSAINPIIYSIRIKKFRQTCGMWFPSRLKARTNMTSVTKRRVNPSAMYEFQEPSNTSN
ncbi:high-affinity lysophosphatidic acid receptor-like [Mizuhopecten yessoensis]|uniref:G-protein coupled receptor 63 n=1 Tax=Mizuhopecten yessoensis TaxID=6573 RepID=A0A210PUL4_MIZYE|nr:high-affinity lysophosphatidic acid receptor-like [Mizuhopecten yessoensis]OWF40178.1 G-protein coupled receptor 63 [Mizuhopecten yessoensis]